LLIGPAPGGRVRRAIWEKLPDDTDILITHGPPIGYGDLLSTGKRAGDVDLLYHIQRYALLMWQTGSWRMVSIKCSWHLPKSTFELL
jgi:hypothetical protein